MGPPACEDCAACCTGAGAGYVPVSGEDHARLGVQAERWTEFLGQRCFMRMQRGRCIALVDAPEGKRLCAIYALRPVVCRELERGSAACVAEILRKGAASVEAGGSVAGPPSTRPTGDSGDRRLAWEQPASPREP